MTRIPTSQSICPCCGAKVPRVPTRKRHCPSCKQVMYVKSLDDGTYAVTEDELKVIKEEKREQYSKPQRRNKFGKKSYPISIVSIVSVFVLFALAGVSSGWLWFLGVIVAIALFFLLGHWWDDLQRWIHQPRTYGATWLNKSIYLITLILAIGGTFIAVPVIHHIQQSPPISESPVENNQQPSLQQAESLSPYITGGDWVRMTRSEKRTWVQERIDAIIASGEVRRSQLQSVDYYVSELDSICSNPAAIRDQVRNYLALLIVGGR